MLAFLKSKPLPEPKEIPRHEIEAPLAEPIHRSGKGQAVGDSNDLRRVLALPRREIPGEKYLAVIAADLKARLGRVRTPEDPCECAKIKPYAKSPCADNLKLIQAMALHEGEQVGGLLGPIGVGHGKCEGALTEIFDVASGRRRLVSESGPLSVTSMDERTNTLHVRNAVAFPSGEKPCVRLVLADGASIDVSTDHPIFTARGWVHAADIKSDDLVAAPRFMPGPVTPLEINDASVKIVAYLMSDGGVSQRSTSFTQMDGPVLEEALFLFDLLLGGWTERSSLSRAREFYVLGAREFRDQWGLHGLAKQKRLSPEFWGMSDAHCALFLNRFWACDGHISKQGVEITLASEGLIDDLRFLLLRLGVVSRKCFNPKKLNGKSFQAWSLHMHGQQALDFMSKVGPVLGKETAGRALAENLLSTKRNTNHDRVPISRKQFGEICDELGWQGRGGNHPRRDSLRTSAREFLGCTTHQYVSREKFAAFCARYNYRGKYAHHALSDVRWEHVKSLTPQPMQPVYDVSVEETHNLVANNIIIHNTLLDLLMPMVVGGKTWVLLLPPQLKSQLLEVDWNYYSQHWHLPNLVSGKWYTPGRPFLHVVAFSELSGAKNTDLLERLDPDGILVDEAHSVRNRTAARTKRFLRFLDHQKTKKTKLFCWSGTLTSRSLRDYAHLAEHSLGDGSPVPLHWPTVEEWAAHLDPADFRAPAGQLARLSEATGQPRREVEDARDLFRWALIRTPGVVSSGDAASCQASLVISERKVETPKAVQLAINQLEATWQRPDGEELVDALSKARCARELSCGFYYQWRWPKRGGESQKIPVIERWKAARKEWHKELRDKLKHGGAHMDSPLLCTQAAIRWTDGYVHIERDEDGSEKRRHTVPPKSKNGPRPTWDSTYWGLWKEVRNTAFPETEAVWIDDFLVLDSLAWLAEGPGVLWYEFSAYAARLLERGGGRAVTLAGPGEDGNRVVLSLTGKESVIASIRAHGTGKNLQQFARAHVANPPSDGATWEQLLGRHHRTGQEADEVAFGTYRHTEAFRAAVEKARDLSEYIEGTLGTTQRLASVASWGF